MTELEYAQQLFGYDPETTPQRELEKAKWSFSEAKSRFNTDTRVLNELDDNAVYEWWCSGENAIYQTEKRKISKRTAKQIRLAPIHQGDKQTFLPRQQLEAGEFVRRGNGCWRPKFVFGRIIWPQLKEQLAKSARWLERRRTDLDLVELAIACDELLISSEQWQLIEMIMGHAEKSVPPVTLKVNWQQEGF